MIFRRYRKRMEIYSKKQRLQEDLEALAGIFIEAW